MDVYQLQGADIVLVRGRDWIDRTIEEVTHSSYSHVALYAGAGTLIEAQGFRKTGYEPIQAYAGMADVYRLYGLSNNAQRRIVNNARKHIDQRYDYALIPIELIRCAFGIPLPWFEGNRVICSTLVNDAYDAEGKELCPGIRFPTPADIARSTKIRKVGSF